MYRKLNTSKRIGLHDMPNLLELETRITPAYYAFNLLDINSGSGSSNPTQLTSVGNQVFFVADDGIHGSELWCTDGTTSGTSMVLDINAGSTGSSPSNLIALNGKLYFTATNTSNGTELWQSDGTANGTSIVSDINPGSGSSNPSNLAILSTKIIFTANDGSTGTEPWCYDVDLSTTTILRDIRGGQNGSYPFNLTLANNFVYFSADNGEIGNEIYRTDGSQSGTSLVKDLFPGFYGSGAQQYCKIVDDLIFLAIADPNIDWELYKLNTITTNTFLVSDILPGSSGSVPQKFTLSGQLIYFNIGTSSIDHEPWITNGTSAGTKQLKDIWPGGNWSNPANYTDVSGTMFFTANDGTAGIELWKSDGTTAGTVRVKDIQSGTGSSSPANMTNINGTLFFAATTSTNGTEVWSSDGTSANTTIVADINSGVGNSDPSGFTFLNGTILFSATNGSGGRELWILNTNPIVPVSITSGASKTSTYGDTTTFQVIASGTPTSIIYSLAGTVPSGVTINPTTGLINIAPTTSGGSYSFQIIASNRYGSPANQTFFLTVQKKLLTITADPKNTTYLGAIFQGFTSTASGFVNNETMANLQGILAYSGTAVSAIAIGTYTISHSSSSILSSNYSFSFINSMLTITKANLLVRADNKIKTYDGQTYTGFTTTITGFVNGENSSTVSGVAGFTGLAVTAKTAGIHTITPTLNTLAASNYDFSFVNGALTINKATLTVQADNKQKIYDGQVYSGFTTTITGLVNGENISVVSGVAAFTGAGTTSKSAGNYTITPTLNNLAASNYDFSFVNGALTINKATLTVQADNKQKIYDGLLYSGFSTTITGFVSGESSSVISGAPVIGGGATTSRGAGSYSIIPSIGTLQAANYQFQMANGTLLVQKASLTVTADNKSKTYDGRPFNAFSTLVTGFVPGEDTSLISGTAGFGGSSRIATSAGTYTIIPDLGTLAADNYSFSFQNGTLLIRKATLQVAAEFKSKTYDGLVYNGFTASISGFVSNEDATVISGSAAFSGPATTATSAGVHPLLVSAGTLTATNYAFSFVDSALTINKASLTVRADDKQKTYDGQVYSAFTTTITGFVNGENQSVISGAAAFIGPSTTSKGAGSYTITPTLNTLTASNYAFSFVDGMLTINKATLTVRADDKQKTYDGQVYSAFTTTISGFVNGENQSVVSGTASISGSATTATDRGIYPIVLGQGTLAAANYQFSTLVNGTLEIRRTGPSVNGQKSAAFIVNQSTALGAFTVSDPDSGATGILDITVTATRGKVTVGTTTAQSVSFAKKISEANQLLSAVRFTPALDAFAVDQVTVTAQDRDSAGAVLGSWTVDLSPSTGVVAKIADPGRPGKFSLVVQGSMGADSILVKPTVATSTTAYTVTMTGMGTQAYTGITGRILVYGFAGNDTLTASTVKITTQLYGGDGDDIMWGGSAADILYGGGGNDLMVGGAGADALYGEAGNDMLVDGNIALKSRTDTLDKVLATWNSLPAPTTSIYSNITARITPTFDKAVRDTMSGGAGTDWFWSATAGAVADVTDLVAGEKRRIV